MTEFKPTHRWNGTDQLNGDHAEHHPMRGIACMIVSRWGMQPSGYDTLVAARLDDACRAYATGGGFKSPAEAEAFFRQQGFVHGDLVEMEANIAEELEPLPASN